MENFYREEKILSADKAVEILNGQSIVFASGVFDLLHTGHISFLRKAKEIVGDNGKLVLAIHDDESVKKHKGENRPIMSLNKRLDLLSELSAIDYVIAWYGWENIIDFVLQLKPKFFAITDKSYDNTKKGEWKGNSWDKIAEEIGAQIIKIKLEDGQSTSNIEKILKNFSE